MLTYYFKNFMLNSTIDEIMLFPQDVKSGPNRLTDSEVWNSSVDVTITKPLRYFDSDSVKITYTFLRYFDSLYKLFSIYLSK